MGLTCTALVSQQPYGPQERTSPCEVAVKLTRAAENKCRRIIVMSVTQPLLVMLSCEHHSRRV